ncbi:MAG: hypothetical protein KDH96_02220 [Candidatus Riesia sp.]|nr:hypothetical protein [Candidatus Riesia sp.]
MYIKLTRKFKTLTDDGKKKAEERFSKFRDNFMSHIEPNEPKKDPMGRTADFYKDLGIPVPEDLIDSSDMPEDMADIFTFRHKFEESDFKWEKASVLIDLGVEEYIEELLEGGCVITFPSGRDLMVVETIEQIEKLISDKKQ